MIAVNLTLGQSDEIIALPNQIRRQNNMDKCLFSLISENCLIEKFT